MPTYLYRCTNCGHEQDIISSMSNIPKTVKCEQCGKRCRRDVIGGMKANPGGIIFKDPTGTSKMDSFDYRAKYNMAKAQESRFKAQEKSHVGPNPYGTD